MKKIYFIVFLSVLLVLSGNGLPPAYAEMNKSCMAVSSETEINDGDVGVLANAGNNSTISGGEALEIMNANIGSDRIVKLTLSVNGETPMDITGLLHGGDHSPYLPAVKYAVNTKLSYTIEYSRPYEFSEITINSYGVSNVKLSRQGASTYKVAFTTTGQGFVEVHARDTEIIFGIRIDTLQGGFPGH